jgi:hypothetical protein
MQTQSILTSQKSVLVIFALFILSIPMNPLFRDIGFYLLGLLCVLFFCFITIAQNIKLKFSSYEIMYFLFIIFSIISVTYSPRGEVYAIKYQCLYFIFIIALVRSLYFLLKSWDKVVYFIS